jgi:hypothetical protein
MNRFSISHGRRVMTVGLFLLLALALAGVPAVQPVSAAAPNYRPDGRILLPCHVELEDCQPEWRGDNIYNLTADGQRAKWYDCCGFEDGPVIFRISIQNDGTQTDRFRVAAGGNTSGYRVAFFRGATDITAAVKAGTYKTPMLEPGATYGIRVRITIREGAISGDKAVRLVTLTSLGNPGKQDAVKAVRELFLCGC